MTSAMRIVVLFVLALPMVARADHLGLVEWEYDLDAGLRRAKEKRLPAMLVFSADS